MRCRRRVAIIVQSVFLMSLIAECWAAGFRPHKHADGNESNELRIIGGSKVPQSKYPWMVVLAGTLPRCGGAAVDEYWVLTASHCVLNGDETEIISARASQTVYFGCENLSEKSCQQRTVVEIRSNPCFDPCCDFADITLLKLDRPMNLGRLLPRVDGINSDFFETTLEPVKAGQGMADVTMMGWGSTCPHANAICAPNDLYELTVPVSTQAKCKLVNPTNSRTNGGHCNVRNRCKALFDETSGHVFCAGGAMADLGGKDSCNGDSGSPVVWLDKAANSHVIVGVLILGSEEPRLDENCGAVGRHSVVTQVSKYAGWIIHTVTGGGSARSLLNTDCSSTLDGSRNVWPRSFSVKLILAFPISKTDFTQPKQNKLIMSLAAAAAAKPADVTIDSVEAQSGRRGAGGDGEGGVVTLWGEEGGGAVGRWQLGRRGATHLLQAQPPGIRVAASIKAGDESAAAALVQALTADKINIELQKSDTTFPKATLLGPPEVWRVVAGSNGTAGGIVSEAPRRALASPAAPVAWLLPLLIVVIYVYI